jgi:putative oxidoreductase
MNLQGLVGVNRSWKLNDFALLLFRVMLSASLFAHHGWEKVSGFSRMAQHFPDPIHIGVLPSLACATLADGICSLLIILGLATRAASIFVLGNLVVVYFIVHKALENSFFKMAPPPGLAMPQPMPGGGGDHLELVFLYLAGYLLLALVGGGAFSLDRKFGVEQ